MACNMLLKNFESGYKPSKSISIARLYRLAQHLVDTADERQNAQARKNVLHNGGIQHATVTLDRPQLTYLVACMEDYVEPASCRGLTKALAQARDRLVGDAELDESAPYRKENDLPTSS